MSNDPKIVLLSMVMLVSAGVCVGALLVIDEGASTTAAIAGLGGALLGGTVGMLMGLPDPDGRESRGSLASMGLSGIGIAAAVRFGPAWLGIALVFAGTVFLLVLGLRRLKNIETSGLDD